MGLDVAVAVETPAVDDITEVPFLPVVDDGGLMEAVEFEEPIVVDLFKVLVELEESRGYLLLRLED